MILRILIFLAILLLLPIWAIDRLYLKRRLSKKWRMVCALPNVLLLLGLTALAINESYAAWADQCKGTLLCWAIAFSCSETVIALLLGLAWLLRRWSGVARAIRATAWACGAALFAASVYGFTQGYRHIVVREHTYSSARLPRAFDGYRLVQLSDLHLGTLSGHPDVVRRIVDSVNAQRPDLVVFTGDLVNYHAEEVEAFHELLRQFKAPDGVVSVMGNHDYAQYFAWPTPADSVADIRRLHSYHKAMGWRLLLNDHILLRRGADSLAIVGVENDGLPPFPALADLPRALRGLGPDCFKILLSHDPTHWRRAVLPDTDIDLTLSGHTHGTQFKVGSFSPAEWFYKEWGGAYREGGRELYVSLGTGEVLLPFRLGAWPEINVITLKSKP